MKRIPKTLCLLLAALTLIAFTALQLPAQEASAPADKAPSASAPAKAPKAPKVSKPAFQGKVNLNTATAKELEQLPRVGPKLAERIVAYRTEHKAFRSVDELRNVKGVGAKVLETLRPHLTL